MKIKEDKFIKGLIIALVPLILLSIAIDVVLIDFFIDARTNTFDKVFVFLSQIFTKGIIFILVLLLLFKKGCRKCIWPWIFTAALASAVVYVLKNIIKTPRPFETYPYISNLILVNGFSFPSGHATLIFAALPLLFMTYPRQRWLFFIIALILALSRIYLGVHYVSDILAGMFIGLLAASIVLLIRSKMKN